MNPYNDPAVTDPSRWEKKAIAFVTRSHQQLWGKNNEEPLAWLFEQGFENAFAKKMHLGWNKHAQTRAADTWGLTISTQKMTLPAGIVIPYIVKKKLLSIFIYPFETEDNTKTIPGSQSDTLILGNQHHTVAVISNIIHGFYLFQETGDSAVTVVTTDIRQFFSNFKKTGLKKDTRVLVFFSDPSEKARFKNENLQFDHSHLHLYKIKDDLIQIFHRRS